MHPIRPSVTIGPFVTGSKRVRTRSRACLTALLLVAGGCVERTTAASDPMVAIAALRPTQGYRTSGFVRFETLDGRLRVHSEVSGLAPGAHGYHVHVYGDCSAGDASSAGPHFDFLGSPAAAGRITGNLGELVAEASGRAEHESEVEHAGLLGPRSILGRAVVVHERGNDPQAPPSGNAGAPVACGVIGVAKP